MDVALIFMLHYLQSFHTHMDTHSTVGWFALRRGLKEVHRFVKSFLMEVGRQ